MKQKIKIMEHKPELSDDEIRSYMDFDRLMAKRKLVNPPTRLNAVVKFVVPAVIIAGLTTWLLFISDSSQSKEAELPGGSMVKQQELPAATAPASIPEPSVQKDEVEAIDHKDKKDKSRPLSSSQDVPLKQETTNRKKASGINDVYTQAEPSDGYPTLYAYFNKALVYPKVAIKDSIQGIQTVSFDIDEDGKPQRIEIKQSLGEPFEKEAIRLIENMPPWKAATLNGKPVASRVSLPLTFQIQKIKDNK